MFGKKDKILSIEIGEVHIKFILVEKKKDKKIIRDIVKIDLDSNLENREKRAFNKIKEVIEENRWEKVKKNLIYDSPSIVIRDIEVPRIPKNELRPVITREVEDIYGDISNKRLVYDVIGEVQKGDSKVYQIFFALVEERDIKNIEKKKLNLKNIDLEIFADNRIFKEIVSEEDNTLVLDMTREKTTIYIYRGKHLKIYRELNIGGDVIDQKICGSLNVTKEEAEKIKIKYGYVNQKRAQELKDNGDKTGIPLNLIYQDIIGQWNRKIETSIEYFKNNNQGEGIDEFLVTGKGSDLKGIKDFFQESWDIPVEDFLADTLFLDKTPKDKKIDFKRDIASLGAALIEEPIIDLKKEESEENTGDRLKYIGVAIIVIIVLFIGYKRYQIFRGEKEIKTYRNKISKLESPLEDYEELSQKESFLQKRIEELDQMNNKNAGFVDFLYNLSLIISDNIYFEGINFSKQIVTLKGKSISNGGFPEIAINNFLSKLDEDYKQVNLVNMRRLEDKIVSFEINLKLNGGEIGDEKTK